MKNLVVCAAILLVVSTAPAMAQSCNGTNVITPLVSLDNRVPGPPSPTSVVSIRYTFGNDVTSDCDSDGGNGGVAQSVHQVTIRPSCNFVDGTCVNDPGGDDGNPLTPAVEYFSLDATTCTGGLANVTVDSSDPFSVILRFAVALIFPPNTNCSVDVALHVRERGDATTTNTIAQQYATDGVCLCTPELIAVGVASSRIFLTCPPCTTNFCAPEHCDATSFQCVADPAPDCTNPDNDMCTSGSCDPAADGGNGACVNGPITCDDSNPCTDDSCIPAAGCVHAANVVPCDDGNPCTVGDVCADGACTGTSVGGPSEVQSVVMASDKATFGWAASTNATQYDVVRGSTGAFPVGPGGTDEVCFDSLTVTTLVDTAVPNPGTGFWYLSRGENSCGVGTWGAQSDGSPRITTTCP